MPVTDMGPRCPAEGTTMAKMYTDLTGDETPSEKRLYDLFKTALSDDFMVWHRRDRPTIGREIDFAVLHRVYGIWIIEEKGWLIGQVSELTQDTCLLTTMGKTERKSNPLAQAHQAYVRVKELLQKQPGLTHEQGIHQGKLVIPIHYFVVLSNISRFEIDERGDCAAEWPSEWVWTSEDLCEPEFAEKPLQERLVETRPKVRFTAHLSDSQVDVVEDVFGRDTKGLTNEQVHIIKKTAFDVPPVLDALSGEEVSTLDDVQNRLVHHPIESHLVIEGPAGSGKSIVLVKRALFIRQQHPEWDICIMCFNTVMANQIRTLLELETKETARPSKQIDVYDVHNYAAEFGLPRWEDLRTPIQIRKHYNALLVDEGQDSKPAMMRMYRQMLIGTRESFTFCYDERQSLYTEGEVIPELRKWGFNVHGERKLLLQQRSIITLAALAYFDEMTYDLFSGDVYPADPESIMNEYAEGMFVPLAYPDCEKEDRQPLLFSAHWLGFDESLNQSLVLVDPDAQPNYNTMVSDVVSKITSLRTQGYSYGDFLVTFPKRRVPYTTPAGRTYYFTFPSKLREAFIAAAIPCVYVSDPDKPSGFEFDGTWFTETGDNRRSVRLDSDKVKIMTIHHSKGLDAANVFVLGFDSILRESDEENKDAIANAAKLGYVALTRAKKRCYVYAYDIFTTAYYALYNALSEAKNLEWRPPDGEDYWP